MTRPGPHLDPATSHEVTTGETPGGLGYARCACGGWEAVVTGPRSARWAFEQYAEHLANADTARADALPPG